MLYGAIYVPAYVWTILHTAMTVRELIKALQDLGEKNLDREIIMFDGPSYYTPYKVAVLEDKSWGHQKGKILID